jgi:hypothetical protein
VGDWVEIQTGCFSGQLVEVVGISPEEKGEVEVRGKTWAITSTLFPLVSHNLVTGEAENWLAKAKRQRQIAQIVKICPHLLLIYVGYFWPMGNVQITCSLEKIT